ncbi:putative secreted protein (type I secretion substrate) [Hasllibacter halocynthiae]|uniref:Putative secreted protein (Type I secretion substrate) n=1 Tax=Hasllibacter halocynthiae TaxID=595589 RepID=A0A2T0X9L2_9RHOB|nr:M10 family metallopeptidase [Hasllibacter halocynthiae]PRY95613.1 putative secreted protein (type I secretion substrate) [Hasllibacter halocynthiae]
MPSPEAFTDQQIADALTQRGLHWARDALTYSYGDVSTRGNALDATHRAWIEQAVAQVGALIDVDFRLVGTGGDISFNASAGKGTYASTSYYVSSGRIASSDIHFDQNWSSNASKNLDYGSYGVTTILHEFLHALGLGHPGRYDASDGGGITYADDAEFRQDTHRYTVMSYFRAGSDDSGTEHWFREADGRWSYQYPQTPMVYDILALTAGNFDGRFGGYAANAATRAEDTTYGYGATPGIDAVFDFQVNEGPVLTIYDAGGTDTFDLSGEAVREGAHIDLRPGAYSSTHGMTNNIGIAFGTSIENANGTRFADAIIGNDADNTIAGGGGDDILEGGEGADTFVLADGDGHDTITDFVIGTDRIDLSALPASKIRATTVSQADGDVVIHVDGATSIRLSNPQGSGGDNLLATLSSQLSNHAPELSVRDVTLAPGERLGLEAFATFSDADGDVPTHYRIYDPSGGHNWLVEGVARDASGGASVFPPALLGLQGDAHAGTQTLWMRAYDGQDWSAWSAFDLTTQRAANHVPELSVRDVTLAPGERLGLEAFATFSDADGDVPTHYRIYDPSGGHNWLVEGVARDASGGASVFPPALLGLQGDAHAGTQTLWMRAYDGQDWSAWSAFDLTTQRAAKPATMAVEDLDLAAGSWVRLDTVATYSHRDDAPFLLCQIEDREGPPNFYVVEEEGARYVDAATPFEFDATMLADIYFKADANAGDSSDLRIRAYDGHEWTDWDAWTVTAV